MPSIIEKWDDYKQAVKRINWNEYFILQAYLVSNRSLDAQTQCGCILTKPDYTPVASGYNSFMRQIDDTILPNLRPEKYPFFLHAEHNAILNCAKNGYSTDGCLAYITSQPCNTCFQIMHQAGISEIIFYDGKSAHMTRNPEYEEVSKILKSLSPMKISIISNTPQMNEKILKIKSCQ